MTVLREYARLLECKSEGPHKIIPNQEYLAKRSQTTTAEGAQGNPWQIYGSTTSVLYIIISLFI